MLVLLMTPLALASAMAVQQQPAQPTAQRDPAKLPAHEAHQDLLVAGDPWVTAEEYKARFAKTSPFDFGVIAIDVFFKNDGALPVRINLDTIRLTIAHERSADENLPPVAAITILHTTCWEIRRAGKTPNKGARLPIPIGGGKTIKKVLELADVLHGVQLSTDLVPPHSTVHGLLYFDVDGQFEWLTTARLYVPDLKVMGTDKVLFFFDVDLGKAVEQ